MSISSIFYTGMSSLLCLGEKMGTLGDNIANINTTGFRASQVSFEDILFEATNTGGVRLSPTGIKSDFSEEGSIQSSHIATHMAISGDGFFILRDSEDTSSTYYTRAGEFHFDADNERTEPESYLINPSGYRVQGYQFNSDGTEEPTLTDIRLELTRNTVVDYIDEDGTTHYHNEDRLVSTPKASTRLTLISNLDANGQDHSPGGLFENWDGTQEEPISSNHDEYRVEQDIYDSSGDRHSIVVYYDKNPQDTQDNVWEYLITFFTPDPEQAGTVLDYGVLARGTITFDNSGYISGNKENITMDNYQDGVWVPVNEPNDNGYLAFQTPFEGAENIELDMGAQFVKEFDMSGQLVDEYWQHGPSTTTQFGYESYTAISNTDGYGESELTGLSVSSDGIIRANFENGVTSDLFRVGLANSMDPSSHFRRIGSTLYQVDPESGGLITDNPGSSGLGSIIASSLETSNVDMAEQFGDLIFTQRAFQANAKSMVAADEMLKTLIALRR